MPPPRIVMTTPKEAEMGTSTWKNSAPILIPTKASTSATAYGGLVEVEGEEEWVRVRWVVVL